MSRFINARLESDTESDSETESKSDTELIAKLKSNSDSEKDILLFVDLKQVLNLFYVHIFREQFFLANSFLLKK